MYRNQRDLIMRRIQRDSSYEELVRHFSAGEQPLFKEIWRLLLFSASLGYHLGERRPISRSDTGKAFPESYFSNCPAWPGFLYLMGICETESADILKSGQEPEELLIRAFEEYATHGLTVLSEASNRFDDPLDAVLDLIMVNVAQPDLASKPIDFGDLI
jgi:dnd system-associated protein 4